MRMKKIFSILVALALVMSAAAVPFGKNDDKPQPIKRIATQKVQLLSSTQKQAKAVKALNANPVKGVKKAKASNVTLDFPALTYSDHVADHGWWQLYGQNADGVYVSFSNSNTISQAAGTYDIATEMDADYTYVSYDGVNAIGFVSGTVTLSFDANSVAHLSATAVGEDGNNYTITAAQKVITPSSNVITMTYSNGMLNIATTNNDPYFLIIETRATYDQYQTDFSQASLNGEVDGWYATLANYGYTEDMLFSGGQQIDVNEYYQLLNSELEEATDLVALVAPYDDDERNGNASYLEFNYAPAPFVPTGETINVVFREPMEKMKYYSTDGDWWMNSNREGLYKAYLDIVNNDATSPAGTYTEEDFLMNYTYIYVYEDSTSTKSTKLSTKSAEAVVTDANDTISVFANILAKDGNVYSISMFFAKPTAQFEAEIEASNLKISEGWGTSAVASNDDYEVSLSLSGSSIVGSYTIGQNASGSINIIAENSTVSIYSGSFDITLNDDGQYELEGEVLCMNNTAYTLTLWYELPTATRNETLTITDAQIALYDGAWQIVGLNADKSRYISVAAMTDAVSGTYAANDLYADYSFVAELGADTMYYDFLTADLTVVYNENDSTFSLTGTGLMQNEDNEADAPFYTFNVSGKLADQGSTPEAIEYDEQSSDFAVNFNEYTEYDENLAQYGVVVIEAEDDDLNYVALYLVANAGDTELMPGEYPVTSSWEDDSWAASTTIAGTYDATQGLYPSYAAILIEQQGQLYINNVWYIVGGTVKVNADYSIDINATNSYGRTITSHMTGRQTPVEEVKVESAAIKRIENGVLLIERNGATYNAQGIRQ